MPYEGHCCIKVGSQIIVVGGWDPYSEFCVVKEFLFVSCHVRYGYPTTFHYILDFVSSHSNLVKITRVLPRSFIESLRPRTPPTPWNASNNT